MKSNTVRSPLFYVGDKYKLIPQLTALFPNQINSFYEPFVGGGSVFLNIEANDYHLNDFDENIIKIHKYLYKQAKNPLIFFKNAEGIIKKYNLSRSFKEDVVPDELKKQWKKTYYARYNKSSYEKLRDDFNKSGHKDPLVMYLLLIYGFNRMLRFNKSGLFNLPVGNVDFNKNAIRALNEYFQITREKTLIFTNMDYRVFISENEYSHDDFIYLDPPYLITFSEYNKFWGGAQEKDLLNMLDELNNKNVRFALSNVTHYNDNKNDILIDWMARYNVHPIKSNYISYNNNSTIKNITEVLITNYA